jgi:hypothetical protein
LDYQLLGNYLKDKISASTTQEVASLADAAGAQGVAHIKCGAQGRNIKNLSRDLMRYVKRLENNSKVFTPEPYFVPLPILDTETQATIYVQHPILLPHEMISWLLATKTCHLADICKFTRDNN